MDRYRNTGMPYSKFYLRVLFITLPVLLLAWTAQAQYRHKTLLEDRFVHQPVANQDCTVCHDLHFPEAPGQISKAIPDLCFKCHKDPAAGKKVAHAPTKEGKCLSCHYPHSAPLRDLLKVDPPGLCIGCHVDKKGGRHGTSRIEGECLQCHDPHASDSSSLLRAVSIGQCQACHEYIANETYKHSALEEYECQECHNPHISPPEPAIACEECHDDKPSGANIHPAMEEGCNSCHYPHSGPYPNQLNNPILDLCIQCHDQKSSGRHGKIEVGTDCVRCHDPHSSQGRGLLTPSALGAPCASCHVDIIKAKNQHTPVRNTKCSRCHDPHSPTPADTLICLDCHSGIMDARYDHPPAEEGCDSCHITHGSDFENHLIDSVPTLCLQCHPEKEKGKHGKVLLGDDCKRCHDPHSSLQPGLLTIVKEAAACESCHQAQRAGTVVHSPILESDCDECHDPHSDPPEPTAACLDCHESVLDGQYRHDAAEDDCSNCHETHSGQLAKLLKGEIPAICLECHDDKEEGRHGGTLLSTNCDGCHEPHSSPRNKLLRALGDRSCPDCHTNKTKAKYVHSALEEYQCRHCHNPHKDPPEMPPIECRKCHLDIADRSVAHGSPSYGRCVECHDPHGSGSPSLLKEEGSGPAGDCLECHRDVRRDIDNGRYLHEPVTEGDCSDCHTAHKGKAPFTVERFDRRKNVPYDPEAYELCFQCHSSTLVQVKFTETDTGFRHRRWNLHNLHVMRDGERGFSCWICHSPHASRQPHLINMEVPFSKMYSLKIDYRKTENGGQCRTNCHSVQEYSR